MFSGEATSCSVAKLAGGAGVNFLRPRCNHLPPEEQPRKMDPAYV